MDIPDNFTITIHSETAPINYTVLRCSDDMFVVKWERPKNSFHYVELSRVEVINALSRGIWTIVEQKENNMEQQTIKQMEQNVAELLAKAEEMKQLIEKAKKEQTWPNYHDAYWYASGNGHVYRDCWENTIDDLNRQKFGNIHRSRAEAEDYVQKRLAQVELEQLAEKAWKASGINPNWNTREQKFHIYYATSSKDFRIDSPSVVRYVGQVFFPTEDTAAQAIATIGQERLKVLVK